MAWAEELVKLQRIRRAFIRFAQEFNPIGWLGHPDRRFAKTADSTGEIPVFGQVESFGIFRNALANHEHTIEVPSIQSVLLDPVNEWRALGDRPSNQLLQRKLAYYLRQHDDDDNILDEMIALGVITSPNFPPGKVSLNLTITGGDLLGEDVGRRLLTTEDWPRALPEHLGRVIPFVYGHLTNNIAEIIEEEETPPDEVPPGCITCTEGAFYVEDFANAPATWEGAGNFTGPPDPNYPFVYTATRVDIVPGGGPSGENMISVIENPFSPVINSHILFANFNGPNTVLNNDVACRAGSLAFKLRPKNSILAGLGSGLWFNFISMETLSGIQMGVHIMRTGAVSGGVAPVTVRLLWREGLQILHVSELPGQTFTADEWHDYEVSWQLGTLSFDESCVSTPAADGFLRIKRDGATWFEVTDVPMIGRGNYCGSTIRLGGQRMLGDYCGFSMTFSDEPSPEPPVEVPPPPTSTATVDCHDSDGVNDQGAAGRGGWIEALLVDTGGGNIAISDYGVPAAGSAVVQPQPYPAPSLSASAQAGGNGTFGGTLYYAVVSVTAGVVSELSNVVSVSVAAGQKVHLTWTGTGDYIRVYRSEQSTFEAYDTYRVSGYPYAVSDVPLSNGSVDDLYPGYDTRNEPPTPDGQDPHWDLTYRQTKFYYVSAIYADGTESECSPAMGVGLYPRTAPLNVEVTWSAPAPGDVAVSAYRVRRQSQLHSFEPGFDREWVFDAGTTSFVDTLTDTSSVSACATAPTGTGTTGDQKPTYCLAGHWLKAVNQVFVLKPDPESDTNEFVQVLMEEGVDYVQEVFERNGNRYHCIVFNEQQRSETCQYYKVSANVDGVETNADGTGILLEDADDIVEHILLNVIFNTYRSSIGQYAPIGGKYYNDVEWSPGLFNRDSITFAKEESQRRVSGGYVGAGAIVEKTPARQLIWDLLVSFDLQLYQYRGTWYVKRFSANLDRGSLPTIDPNIIIKDTFEPAILEDKQVNLIPYFAGPIGGGENEGYLISGEIEDNQSIELYRRIIISEPIYLLWTQHAPTANSVVRQYMSRWRYPPINATFEGIPGLYILPPGAEVLISHPDGLGSSGWVNRACVILANDLDLDSLTCKVTVREVDNLIP